MTIKQVPPIFTWLGLAALADWLVTRTLVRAAIFMPKPEAVLSVYQGIGFLGQVAASLTSLLAFLALGWIAVQQIRQWQRLHDKGDLALAATCLGLISISLLGLVVPSAGWLALSFQTLICAAFLLLTWQTWRGPVSREAKAVISLSGAALLAGRLYQIGGAVYTILGLAGPPPSSELLFNAGELLVILSVLALWWRYGRRAPWWAWLVAGLPALAFAMFHLKAPAMAGIMTIWSTGLTLYLPWPAYFVALWLAGVAVANGLRRGNPAGWAILLIAAGGYASQLSIHAFLGLVALWLLVQSELGAGITAGQTSPRVEYNLFVGAKQANDIT